MKINPISSLKNGDFMFLGDLSIYEIKDITDKIKNSPDKNSIINGFIENAIDVFPSFCFNLIYDLDEYKDKTIYLLKKYRNRVNFTEEKLLNILYYTDFGKEFIVDNFEEITSFIKTESVEKIFSYLLKDFDSNKKFIEKISTHENLHIRFLFIKYIALNNSDKINVIYDDITKYFKNCSDDGKVVQIMDEKELSVLAVTFLNSNLDKQFYEKIKQFILDNYKKNDLAKELLQSKSSKSISAFNLEADEMFCNSATYQFEIFKNYSEYVSKELLDDFYKYIKYFYHNGLPECRLEKIFDNGLGKKLKFFVDKYLSLSKDTSSSFIGKGTTASCYRLGDYVIKFNITKWSYEDDICPNLYLILKNEDEVYVRNEKGIVLAGIEVQKYLTRSSDELPENAIELFNEELSKLGYYCTDTYINGVCGDNCMLLNSYKDADCDNPEELPDSFKKLPLVLVDRDRVYKLDNKKPKQLRPY